MLNTREIELGEENEAMLSISDGISDQVASATASGMVHCTKCGSVHPAPACK